MNSEPLLPFSFAKEFNILLEKEDENNILHCITTPKLSVLGELQRKFGFFEIFAISFSLVIAFSFLSAEVLPRINRYPMKLFSEKILSEKFSGPIAVYRLGNQRARLGVLTGKKVLKLYSPSQIKQFINADEQVLIIMREEDLRKNDVPLKIVAEDIAWLEGRIDGKRLNELWEKAESAGFSGLTEKIYLLTNK